MIFIGFMTTKMEKFGTNLNTELAPFIRRLEKLFKTAVVRITEIPTADVGWP